MTQRDNNQRKSDLDSKMGGKEVEILFFELHHLQF